MLKVAEYKIEIAGNSAFGSDLLASLFLDGRSQLSVANVKSGLDIITDFYSKNGYDAAFVRDFTIDNTAKVIKIDNNN